MRRDRHTATHPEQSHAGQACVCAKLQTASEELDCLDISHAAPGGRLSQVRGRAMLSRLSDLLRAWLAVGRVRPGAVCAAACTLGVCLTEALGTPGGSKATAGRRQHTPAAAAALKLRNHTQWAPPIMAQCGSCMVCLNSVSEKRNACLQLHTRLEKHGRERRHPAHSRISRSIVTRCVANCPHAVLLLATALTCTAVPLAGTPCWQHHNRVLMCIQLERPVMQQTTTRLHSANSQQLVSLAASSTMAGCVRSGL